MALLATPALLKNHQLDPCLICFERLNTLMQQKERPKESEVRFEVMKILQHLTKETALYGPVLVDAIDYALEQNKTTL